MWKCRLVKFCLVFASLFIIIACSSGTEKVVKYECGERCHNISAVTNKHYSELMWRNTVSAMVTKGAHLDKEQQNEVVKYLTKKYGI